MSEENQAVARRFFEEVWNGNNLDVVDEIFASDYVHNIPDGNKAQGPERVKYSTSRYRSSFPDITFTIDEMIAEGDKVVTRWTGRGTHQAEYDGFPPSGNPVTLRGIDIQRIVSGKIVEGWRQWNRTALLEQLGAVPNR